MQSEEVASVQCLQHIVEDDRVAPDEAHWGEVEGEAVEGNDTVGRVHHSVVSLAWGVDHSVVSLAWEGTPQCCQSRLGEYTTVLSVSSALVQNL